MGHSLSNIMFIKCTICLLKLTSSLSIPSPFNTISYNHSDFNRVPNSHQFDLRIVTRDLHDSTSMITIELTVKRGY